MANALKDLGHAATESGWRGKVAERAAPVVAKKTPASQDAVRAALGLAFLTISLIHLARVFKSFRERR
jgi:hypothetical protein